MDAKIHARMVRGKLAPEARLDLHGMTLAEAQPELIRFVLNAQEAGLRLVLVITGKGKMTFEPVPRPIGALRHQVPHWLRLPPLAQAVQQVTEAHLKHGGGGALYVYLRRR
jgi:DNA-nicking Smr family endonuclease